MRTFRVLLALVVAGATFYGLDVLAVQNGYRSKLDFRNRDLKRHDCGQHYEGQSSSHRSKRMADTTVNIQPDSVTNKIDNNLNK